MLDRLAQTIQQRLMATGLFKQVMLSVNENQVYQYPSAIIYLSKDVYIKDTPAAQRELTWTILVATRATPVTEQRAAASVYEILDRVRTDLTGWSPMAYGISPTTVPEIEFAEWQNGVMVYAVQFRMRVVPSVIV